MSHNIKNKDNMDSLVEHRPDNPENIYIHKDAVLWDVTLCDS
jgi:hypothetical protein